VFSIAFGSEPPYPLDGTGPLRRDALIVMDDFTEVFAAPIDFWNETDYERQWQEGAQRLVDGATQSCLLTRVEDPTQDPILRWWALYRRPGDSVTVREHLWLPEFGSVDLADPYSAVGEYPNEPER
jgi:hypothetical protein